MRERRRSNLYGRASLCALVTILLGCATSPPEPPPRIQYLRQRAGPLFVGDRIAISANVCTAPNRNCRADPPVAMSIAGDTTVARTRAPSSIEALTPGRVVVRLTADGFAPDSFEVVVLRRVHSLQLLPSDTTVAVGDMIHLRATALDSAGAPVEGAWVQFNWDIFDFDNVWEKADSHYPPELRIVAQKRGKYTITARVFDHPSLSDSTRLTVVRRRASP